MTQVAKIDANSTGLRWSEELSLGVVDPSAVWKPLEPNSYSDFGGQITTTPRAPIQPSRQRKKGVTTDLEAGGGFNMDLTQKNLTELMQGFFFADQRPKPTNLPLDSAASAIAISNVDTAADTFDVAGTTDNSWDDLGQWATMLERPVFLDGHLFLASGFPDAANNGLFLAGVVTATVLPALAYAGGPSVNLVDDAGPPVDAECSAVGFQFDSGDATIDFDGPSGFVALETVSQDLRDFGLTPGEWVFIGGDDVATQFVVAQDGSGTANGFYRIRAISQNRIDFDKTPQTIDADDPGTSKTIHMFFGRVLKNEAGPSANPPIKRRTYQLERELGAPDDQSADTQGEYLVGQVASELTFNMPTADKLTMDLTFLGTDHEPTDVGPFPKGGARPSVVEADAFNTSSDFSRIRMWVHDETNGFPTSLFAFVQEINLTINNNLSGAKAVGVLGNCEITAGDFQVSGSITAYFGNVAAMEAVRANSEVTLDFHMVKANAGISVDIPLITLGEGRATVEKDAKITLPLSVDAATGAKIDSALNHTLLMVYYDYLPDLADS